MVLPRFEVWEAAEISTPISPSVPEAPLCEIQVGAVTVGRDPRRADADTSPVAWPLAAPSKKDAGEVLANLAAVPFEFIR